ncbi:MAG: ABC transporter ATP-binding protein [Lachnospiraceae bacterium]|nr:ABC transporter ATP-binding protein [Lachnospiraceae bacterium]
MNNEKKLLSWKEAYKLNIRAFLLIYKRYPKMIISRVILAIVIALTPYVGIYFSARIIGELAGARDITRIKELVLATLISAAIISLVRWIIQRWRNTECAGMYYKIEMILNEKLLDMDYIDIDDTKMHDLLSIIRQNSNSGGWGLYRIIGSLDGIIDAFFTILGGIVLTVSLFTTKVPESAGKYTILNNPIFILLVAVVMIIIINISPILTNKAGSYYAYNSDSHNLANRLFGFFGFLGHKKELAADIRMYEQDLICNKYIDMRSGMFLSAGFMAKLAKGPIGLYNAAASAVSVIFTGFVYVFVCLKAWAGAFDIGMVTQYVSSITKVAQGVTSIVWRIGDARNNASFLKQVFEFLDIPNTMYQGSLTVEKRCDRDYEIEFRDVSFKYPRSESYALKDVSMKFKIGERLAVVGPNGSGKTTFIKLLCRLYDPTEGEILLNGIDIRKYNYLDYMSIFSVVFQDYKLFAFKLGENVGAKVDYDKEIAKECLIKAGFGDRLAEMENGTETYLYKGYNKDGVDISGGEAQKIALARTLYKDAPFIVLDEPTAALDPVAEAEVYSKFDEIAGDKTAVYISHRLSSCRFCDTIAVFDNGRVVQKGTHEELVAKENGKYHELWFAQAKYYA